MQPPPSISAAELAGRLGGELSGDGTRVVRSVAPLDEAQPDSLSWLGSPEYLPRLTTSKAGVVLVPPGCDVPPERTTICVADPDLALCEALRCLAPRVEPIPPGVHPTAVVEADAVTEGARIGPQVVVGRRAVIGPGTELHAGVYVGPDCAIGRDCVLWPNVVVREHSRIGDRVVIHANATIGADGFGYLQRAGRHIKIPQIGTVLIEDDVEIGANTAIDRARSGVTRIGRGTKIDNLVQIGHNVSTGVNCIIVGQCGISGSTTLGDYVILGGQVGVHDHVRIGNRAQVAAKSAVANCVPDGKVYRGIPAVESNDFARSAVGLRRLPKMIQQLRDLAKRVKQLESAANHSA